MQLAQSGDLRSGAVETYLFQQDIAGLILDRERDKLDLRLTRENYLAYLKSGVLFREYVGPKPGLADSRRRSQQLRLRKPDHSGRANKVGGPSSHLLTLSTSFVQDEEMPSSSHHTELVRSFNRFYTRQIGLLREGLLKTPFSLTQARVLYELAQQPRTRWTNLFQELALDPGYLSRLLKNFEKQGLVRRSTSKNDRRVKYLSLTAKGRNQFQKLNVRSQAEIGGMLATMNPSQQRKLVCSMTAIRELLNPPKIAEQHVNLRTHVPGDIGWVIARHGELYAQEYQWDSSFEGLVAEIAGKFLLHFDEERERCWIAERNGERLGCVFLVAQSKTIAKLRLLLVEPSARGMGVGAKLVDECVAFARRARYRKLTLWTNHVLRDARRIYERAGFSLVKEEKHHSFGHHLIGQFWELKP